MFNKYRYAMNVKFDAHFVINICQQTFTVSAFLRAPRSYFGNLLLCLHNSIEDLSAHWFFMEISCPAKGYVCQWPDIWEEIGPKLDSIDSDKRKKNDT